LKETKYGVIGLTAAVFLISRCDLTEIKAQRKADKAEMKAVRSSDLA